jgi:hypothetical protein
MHVSFFSRSFLTIIESILDKIQIITPNQRIFLFIFRKKSILTHVLKIPKQYDIDVHNELFNGFGVFSTLKVSRYQVLSNLSLNDISFMIMISRLQLRNPIVFITEIQLNLVMSNSVNSKFRLSRNFSEVPF